MEYPVGRKRYQGVTHIHFEGKSSKYHQFMGLIDGHDAGWGETIAGIDIVAPAQVFQSLPRPQLGYHHLDVPHDVGRILGARQANGLGFTGAGVHVALIDTGHDASHPFFNHYRPKINVDPQNAMPGAGSIAVDESGHGTGISSTLFSVAPDVTLTPIKLKSVGTLLEKEERKLQFAVGLEWGLKRALTLADRPDIVTCSLGIHLRRDQQFTATTSDGGAAGSIERNFIKRFIALEAEIVRAWRGWDGGTGVVLVFAAGNRGTQAFPAQSNYVIAAGGAYVDGQNRLWASSYASGYESDIYEDRTIPDVCGLCGTAKAEGRYIVMPVPPCSRKDRFANDQTMEDDGWACYSGTSAAAPQIAGVAALIRQAFPQIPPDRVRHILKVTARDVKTGISANGSRASTGPDPATGAGLVNAYWAAQMASYYQRLHTAAGLGIGSFPALEDDRNLDLLTEIFGRNV